MTIRDILNDKSFQDRVKTGDVSHIFVKELKHGIFPVQLATRLVYTEKKELKKSEQDILDGIITFDVDPIKISVKPFKSKMEKLLKTTGCNSPTYLIENLVSLYKKANKIIDKEWAISSNSDQIICINDFCIFDNEDNPMSDIVEVNSSEDEDSWVKNGYLLFAWTEDGGAMYIKISEDNVGSIWYCDHELDTLTYVEKSCDALIKKIL